jgi:hypothetical protein
VEANLSQGVNEGFCEAMVERIVWLLKRKKKKMKQNLQGLENVGTESVFLFLEYEDIAWHLQT